MLDELAHRYGGRPSEWRRVPAEELAFDYACFDAGRRERAAAMQGIQAQPVYVVGGS